MKKFDLIIKITPRVFYIVFSEKSKNNFILFSKNLWNSFNLKMNVKLENISFKIKINFNMTKWFCLGYIIKSNFRTFKNLWCSTSKLCRQIILFQEFWGTVFWLQRDFFAFYAIFDRYDCFDFNWKLF